MKENRNELVTKVRELLEIIPSPLVSAWAREMNKRPVGELLTEYESILDSRRRAVLLRMGAFVVFVCIVTLSSLGMIPKTAGLTISVVLGISVGVSLFLTDRYFDTSDPIISEIETVFSRFIKDVENISPPFETDGVTPLTVFTRNKLFMDGMVREKLIALAMNKTRALNEFDRLRFLPTRMFDSIMIAGEQIEKTNSEFNMVWESAVALTLMEFDGRKRIFAEADKRIAEAKRK